MIQFLLNVCMICLCGILIFIQELNNSPRLSIVQIQNYIWTIAFLIYLSDYFSFYAINPIVYLYSATYLIFFNIASFQKKVTVSNLFEINHNSIIENISSKKIEKKVIFTSIICWFLSYPIFIKTFPILFGSGSLSVGMNLLRYQTFGNKPIFSTFEMMLITYILRPVFMVSVIYLAELISIKKIKFRITLVALINSLFLVLLTAGRALLLSLVIYVLVAIIISNGIDLIKILARYKKYLIPAFLVLFIVIYISSQRINRDNGPFAEFLIYYFSSLPYFSKLIEIDKSLDILFLGRATLSFIFDPILLLVKFFYHNLQVEMASQYFSHVSNQVIKVSDVIETNATSSTLLPFYLDGGVFAISISAFVIGYFTAFFESNFWKKLTAVSYGHYLFLIVGIVGSIQNYSFGNITTFMVWILISIILR